MADNTTTSADLLLKEAYQPGMPEWFRKKRPIYDRIKAKYDDMDFVGRRLVLAYETESPQGDGGPRLEGEALPAAGQIQPGNMYVPIKSYYQGLRLTRQLMEQSATARGAFKTAVDRQVVGARDAMEFNLAWDYLHGISTGVVGRVLSYSGTSLIMRNQPTYIGYSGTLGLRRGLVVDSFTAVSGGAQGANNVTIGVINGATDTATVAGGSGFVAGDYVFRHNGRGKGSVGLNGLIDDGTNLATVQGLTRSTEPLANANVLANAGVLRALTPELMDDLCDIAFRTGTGEYPTALYSVTALPKRMASNIRVDRRWDPGEMTLDNGYKAITWTTPGGTIPWITDEYCRPNQILAPRESDLCRAMMNEPKFGELDGRMWRYTDNTDTANAYLYSDQCLAAKVFISHAVARDLSHTL